MAKAASIGCLLILWLTGSPAFGQVSPADLARFGQQVLQEVLNEQALPAQEQPQIVAAPERRSELAEIQRLLNQLGYEAGPVDGLMGPKTRYAIRVFQRHSGLRETGEADPGLLLVLQQAPSQQSVELPAGGSAGGSADGFEILRDFDLPHSDFRSGMEEAGLRGIGLEECQTQCGLDARCRSFTFNVTARVCFLKEAVPQRIAFNGAVSGIKILDSLPLEAPPTGSQVAGTEDDQANTLSTSVDADAAALPAPSAGWIDRVLAPEGLRVGMPAAEAAEVLLARGYTRSDLGCTFTKPGAGTNIWARVSFRVAELLPKPAGGSVDLPDLFVRVEPNGCPTDGMIVTELTVQDSLERDDEIDPMIGIEQVVDRLGMHSGCASLATYEARWCVWRSPGEDAKVAKLTISLDRDYIEAVIEADPTAMRPQDPTRAELAEANAREAASICQNYRPDHVFHDVHDCACIVEEIRSATSVGLVDKVTVSTLDDYAPICPASKARLIAHFEAECLSNYGGRHYDPATKDWALNGGCACVGDRSAESFTADPGQSARGINTLGECGYGSRDQVSQAPDPVKAPDAEVSAIGELSEGLLPVEIWLKDGRPVLYNDWRPLKPLDGTLDYEAQEGALRRWIDLLMLGEDPSLAEYEGALMFLAAENLNESEHQRYLDGCGFGYQSAPYCVWRAQDEFDVRRLEQEFAQAYLQQLIEIGRTMPRELIFVALAQLQDYDNERGGFPVRIVEEASWPNFTITDASLFGFGGLIQGLREPPERTVFWPVSAGEAEATLAELDVRNVQLAWTYRIEVITDPQDQYSPAHKEVVVKLSGAALYADARLTEKLYELPLGPETPRVAPENEGATAVPEVTTAVASRPSELPRKDGMPVILVDPHTDNPEVRRHFELLTIGRHPQLATDPANALNLARNFLVGLADPNGNPSWAGRNEFERARSEATFMASGPAAVIAMAPELPLAVVLVQPARLGEYDFSAQAFPITFDDNEELGEDQTLTIANYSNDSIAGAIFLSIEGTYLPSAWPVPEGEAQQKLADLMEGRINTSPYHRSLFVASTVELTRVELGEANGARFSGRLLGVSLFADGELASEIASIPVGQ